MIPCYNKAEFIEDTVKSCIDQTQSPVEIKVLLMDSGSQSLKDKLENLSPLVKCECHDRLNASEARNYLASKCTTDWIVFLDADDLLEPNFLEVLDKDEGAVCFPNCKILNFIDGKENTHSIPLSRNHPMRAITQNLTFLMHKDVFNDFKLDGRFAIGGEDTDFIYNIFEQKKWKLTYNPDVYYKYHVGINGQLTSSEEFYKSLFNVFKKHAKFIESELKALMNPPSMLIWLFSNFTSENLDKFLAVSTCDTQSDFGIKGRVERKIIKYIVSLLNESKVRVPICEFNDEFFTLNNDILNQEDFNGKKFDIVVYDKVTITDVAKLSTNFESFVANKKVIEDIQSIKGNGLEKFIYLISKYNCIFKHIEINEQIGHLESNDIDYILSSNLGDNLQPYIDKAKYYFADDSMTLYDAKDYHYQHVTFVLDKKCNKKCPYCSVENTEPISKETLLSNFKHAVDKVSELTNGRFVAQIMGGEPTIWDDEFSREVLDVLSECRYISVFTNGSNRNSLFYKNPYAHMITHLTDWEGESYDNFPKQFNETLLIVGTHRCADKLKEFCDTIPQDTEADFNVTLAHGENEFEATLEDLRDFYDIFNNREKPLCYRTRAFYESLENDGIEKVHNDCVNGYGVWSIDCNTNRVSPCCETAEYYDIDDFTGNEKSTQCHKCRTCACYGNWVNIT